MNIVKKDGKSLEDVFATYSPFFVDTTNEKYYLAFGSREEWKEWEDMAEKPDLDNLTCSDCGEPITGQCVVTSDGVVCTECKEDNWVECRDCGRLIRKGEEHLYYDEPLCSRCYQANYFTCDHCGEIHHSDEHHKTGNGDDVCDSCLENHYTLCYSCACYYPTDGMTRRNGHYYCDECCPSDSDRIGYHDYPEDDYIPTAAIGEKVNDKTLYMGVELEADDGEFDGSYFATSFIHFEEDGSLSSEGVECITQPLTLRAHQERIGWGDICSNLIRQGFRSHDTDCCGLHVHLSRSALTVNDIVKMDVWLNRWPIWQDIARRKYIYGGEEWSKFDSEKHIDMIHCTNHQSCNRILSKYKTHSHSHGERYQPLNTQNANTVEIRIFRGSLKTETILGTIECVHGLVQFAKTTPIKRIYDRALATEFVRFLSEHTDMYPHVFPMLKRLAKRNEPQEMLGIIARTAPDAQVHGEQ